MQYDKNLTCVRLVIYLIVPGCSLRRKCIKTPVGLLCMMARRNSRQKWPIGGLLFISFMLLWTMMTWRNLSELGRQGDTNRQNKRLKEWLQSLSKRSIINRRKPETGVSKPQTKTLLPVGIHCNRDATWNNSSNKRQSIYTSETRLSDEEKLRLDGYQKHAFNQLQSDKIGLHRNVPDTRHEL